MCAQHSFLKWDRKIEGAWTRVPTMIRGSSKTLLKTMIFNLTKSFKRCQCRIQITCAAKRLCFSACLCTTFWYYSEHQNHWSWRRNGAITPKTMIQKQNSKPNFSIEAYRTKANAWMKNKKLKKEEEECLRHWMFETRDTRQIESQHLYGFL